MKQSLMQYIQVGGYIMYILVGLSIVSLSIIIWKFIQLKIEKHKTEKSVETMVQELREEHKDISLGDVETQFFNKATNYLLSLESGMTSLQIIATIAPILGLLGTVIGILQAFEAISASGFSEGANSFASSISLALVTTIAGLIVALPSYAGHNYLLGSLEKLEAQYETIIIGKIINEKKNNKNKI